MYIRMTGGREPGRVFDMRDEEAKSMLADGRAVKVDFDDPHALETRIEPHSADQQAQILPEFSQSVKPGSPLAEPAVAVSGAELKRTKRKT